MTGIERHAVLVALLAKHAIEACGEAGREAFLKGITRMAYERGTRMAVRAILDGERLTAAAFQVYGEWRPQPGEMEAALVEEPSGAVTVVRDCPWNNSWKKYGLLAYGKLYCEVVDDALARGFHPELRCTVPCTLSHGAECCRFEWGTSFSEEEERSIGRKKADLGERAVKDFDYHIGHILYSVGGELRVQLGDAGAMATERAETEFAALFGRACLDAARKAYPGTL